MLWLLSREISTTCQKSFKSLEAADAVNSVIHKKSVDGLIFKANKW